MEGQPQSPEFRINLVCAVCLSLFGRQLVFEFLGHLLYVKFTTQK